MYIRAGPVLLLTTFCAVVTRMRAPHSRIEMRSNRKLNAHQLQGCRGLIQCCTQHRSRRAGIKDDAEEKLRQFLADWQQVPQPLPPAANTQRMAIDELHADLIHLQEEKNVFVFQVILRLFQNPPSGELHKALCARVGAR